MLKQPNKIHPPVYSNLLIKLIQNIKNTNNFGYKLIQSKQYQILSKWYSTIHNEKIIIDGQRTQFFAASSVMFGYLILGLTSQGDRILTTQLLDESIKIMIKNLNRNLVMLEVGKMFLGASQEFRDEDLISQFQSKVKNCKLFLFSNPDTICFQVWPQNILKNLMQICKKQEIFVIVDERKGDLTPKFNTMLGTNDKNMIIVKELGSLIDNNGIKKHMCVFGSPEVKNNRITRTAAKSLKILPGDLTIQLIHVLMEGQALQVHKQIMKNIQQNEQYLSKLLKYENFREGISQRLIIHKNKVENKALLNEMLEISLIEDLSKQNLALKDYLSINLKIEPAILQAHTQSLQKQVPSPKF